MSETIVFDEAVRLLTPTQPPCGYSLEDVESCFCVRYADAQRDALRRVPFSAKTLRDCAGTHLLFPGFPLSLLDLERCVPNRFAVNSPHALREAWYLAEDHRFSRRSVEMRWHLLRTEPVPGSADRSWGHQLRFLPSGESAPGVALIAFAAALHLAMSSRRLFGDVGVRTADISATRRRVEFLWSHEHIRITHGWDGCGRPGVGIAAERIVDPRLSV